MVVRNLNIITVIFTLFGSDCLKFAIVWALDMFTLFSAQFPKGVASMDSNNRKKKRSKVSPLNHDEDQSSFDLEVLSDQSKMKR